jgi:hypothetical protein
MEHPGCAIVVGSTLQSVAHQFTCDSTFGPGHRDVREHRVVNNPIPDGILLSLCTFSPQHTKGGARAHKHGLPARTARTSACAATPPASTCPNRLDSADCSSAAASSVNPPARIARFIASSAFTAALSALAPRPPRGLDPSCRCSSHAMALASSRVGISPAGRGSPGDGMGRDGDGDVSVKHLMWLTQEGTSLCPAGKSCHPQETNSAYQRVTSLCVAASK